MMVVVSVGMLVLGCDTGDKVGEESVDEDDVSDALAVDADGDGYDDTEDCDDNNSVVNPSAAEICDGVDNNCDGQIDEGVSTTYYADADGDGFGDEGSPTEACEQPSGYVPIGNDCNDTTAEAFPGAEEKCDGVDNNCDGEIDEGLTEAYYADGDGDGFGDETTGVFACEKPSGMVSDGDDCDDTSADVFPGNPEVCDEADNDCDGDTDEGVTTTYYEDVDGDAYGISDSTTESCDLPTGYSASPGDCDDAASAINPDATEVCDGLDNDCDGDIDDDDASLDSSTGTIFYADDDSDGFGNPDDTTASCTQPGGTVTDSTDCDDAASAINPDATEICDEVDNDCDGDIDDDDADVTGTDTWYLDTDGDAYGDDASTASGCEAPSSSYVSDGGDCDETNTAINPGAAEGCDGTDYDCDGSIDNDNDGDTYSDITCGGDDCDDSDASVIPEAGGGCALGTTCFDVLSSGYSIGDGVYTIDPDGYGTGLDPFDVTCDMTTDGGGWTEIAYDADLDFQQHFISGDGWQYLTSDFTFTLSDAQIEAIQDLSAEGYQEYVGLCEHVIHYYYDAGGNYDYAFGFMFFDTTETPYGSSSYSPYSISLAQDGCSSNGGEGGAEADASIFVIESVEVPLLNVQCRDCGNLFPEEFGSPLTDNPAWLR